MSKSLVDTFKNLPKGHNNSFASRLTLEQQQEYHKAIKYLASLPKENRPSTTVIRRTILEQFKIAPSPTTILRDLEKAELCQA